MNLLQAIILGIIQGFTEFLPVSSSGHLALANRIMGIEGDNLLYFTLLHIATLLSIFTIFAKEMLGLFKPPFKTLGLIILATIPAVLAGLLLDGLVDRAFGDIRFLGFFFLITAVLLLITEYISKHKTADGSLMLKESKGDIGLKTGLIMGFAQAGALFPGISRSGAVISGGVLAKGNRQKVAKFAFFMSVPVILGAALLEGIEGIRAGETIFSINILFGMIAAYISGLLAVSIMLKVISKVNFKWFSLYLAIIGIICIAVFLL
ncbi:MAG: undecaprenyl-diphosphate phosphatase [Firmicutes bacterium]|nr:undecaprenyl-diphosphate phosphatase [Bacillota bacterium]